MRILAIDPGPERSAFIMYDSATKDLIRTVQGEANMAITPNAEMLSILSSICCTPAMSCQPIPGGFCCTNKRGADWLVVEMVQSFGMAVGESVFQTAFWAGRFIQAWDDWGEMRDCSLLYRRDVKLHLCGSARAKDANIRQALIDKFPATGGGKQPVVGTKKQPGPLHGVKSHLWSALALAVTFAETHKGEE